MTPCPAPFFGTIETTITCPYCASETKHKMPLQHRPSEGTVSLSQREGVLWCDERQGGCGRRMAFDAQLHVECEVAGIEGEREMNAA